MVPLSGSFMAILCMECLDDLLRGSEFVSNDYASWARIALECPAFNINRDKMYKDFNPNDVLALYE